MKATAIFFDKVNGELQTILKEYEANTKKEIEYAAKTLARQADYRLVEIRYKLN